MMPEHSREMKKILQKQPPEGSYKQDVLKNFAMFKGKHLCWSLF